MNANDLLPGRTGSPTVNAMAAARNMMLTQVSPELINEVRGIVHRVIGEPSQEGYGALLLSSFRLVGGNLHFTPPAGHKLASPASVALAATLDGAKLVSTMPAILGAADPQPMHERLHQLALGSVYSLIAKEWTRLKPLPEKAQPRQEAN
jgi:hypothetical protein